MNYESVDKPHVGLFIQNEYAFKFTYAGKKFQHRNTAKEEKKMLEIQNKECANRWWKPGCIKAKANSAINVNLGLIWSHQANCSIRQKTCCSTSTWTLFTMICSIILFFLPVTWKMQLWREPKKDAELILLMLGSASASFPLFGLIKKLVWLSTTGWDPPPSWNPTPLSLRDEKLNRCQKLMHELWKIKKDESDAHKLLCL